MARPPNASADGRCEIDPERDCYPHCKVYLIGFGTWLCYLLSRLPACLLVFPTFLRSTQNPKCLYYGGIWVLRHPILHPFYCRRECAARCQQQWIGELPQPSTAKLCPFFIRQCVACAQRCKLATNEGMFPNEQEDRKFTRNKWNTYLLRKVNTGVDEIVHRPVPTSTTIRAQLKYETKFNLSYHAKQC